MDKIKKKADSFYSMKEFDSRFLPSYTLRKKEDAIVDPKIFGIHLASKVLRKIKI